MTELYDISWPDMKKKLIFIVLFYSDLIHSVAPSYMDSLDCLVHNDGKRTRKQKRFRMKRASNV